MTYGTGSPWRCTASTGTSKRSARCSATSASTRRRSMRRSGPRSSSARSGFMTRKRGACSILGRENGVVFEEVYALQREVLQNTQHKTSTKFTWWPQRDSRPFGAYNFAELLGPLKSHLGEDRRDVRPEALAG